MLWLWKIVFIRHQTILIWVYGDSWYWNGSYSFKLLTSHISFCPSIQIKVCYQFSFNSHHFISLSSHMNMSSRSCGLSSQTNCLGVHPCLDSHTIVSVRSASVDSMEVLIILLFHIGFHHGHQSKADHFWTTLQLGWPLLRACANLSSDFSWLFYLC